MSQIKLRSSPSSTRPTEPSCSHLHIRTTCSSSALYWQRQVAASVRSTGIAGSSCTTASASPMVLSRTVNTGSRARLNVKASSSKADPSSTSVPPKKAVPGGGAGSQMQSNYSRATSMAELYSVDRPAPIPLSEHEDKRHKRDVQELVMFAKRKGVPEAAIHSGVTQLAALLPGVLNLHRMSAAQWVDVLVDVNQAAGVMISLKGAYPGADVGAILRSKPRLLLRPIADIQADAAKVRQMLGGSDADAIIQSMPDLIDPATLARTLSQVQGTHKGKDPVQVLLQHPDVLRDQGESRLELSAEYDDQKLGLWFEQVEMRPAAARKLPNYFRP